MNQLLWRCRRGIKELDLLFESFVLNHYPALTNYDKQVFTAMLDESDPDLCDWIAGRSVPANNAYQPLLAKLKALRICPDAD